MKDKKNKITTLTLIIISILLPIFIISLISYKVSPYTLVILVLFGILRIISFNIYILVLPIMMFSLGILLMTLIVIYTNSILKKEHDATRRNVFNNRRNG